MSYSFLQHICLLLIAFFAFISCQHQDTPQSDESSTSSQDTIICGGFLEFDSSFQSIKKNIPFSQIIVQSLSLDMVLKESTNLADSGYYFLPIYENEPIILKISGPNGMSFEPEQYILSEEGKDIKDFCSKDINFKFLGFSIEGQVSTFGSNEGPSNIDLVLYNNKNEQIQTTLTTDKGLFKFKPLYPLANGKYTLKPDSSIQSKFDKTHKEYQFNIHIDKPNFLERALIIKGYKLSGNVVTKKGEPMPNALIAIYSHNNTLVKDYECSHQFISNSNDEFAYKQLTPFCIVNSDMNGEFSFLNIPYGTFTVKAFYKNDYLTYTLNPETQDIEIKHGDVKLNQMFTVNRFSVYGKVLSGKGNGIPNVTIKFDSQIKAVSDKNGIYILENIEEGNTDLEAVADNMVFEPLTNIQLSPRVPQIQDIVVSEYYLSGKITIEQDYNVGKRTVTLVETETRKERTTITDDSGRYKFEVKPGSYKVFPLLTQQEKVSDLHLQPEYYEMTIEDAPVLNANFYQSKVTLKGKIECIKSTCDKDIKVKLIPPRATNVYTANLNPNTFEFEFKDILSGQYKLSIIKPEWCWENEDIEIKVQNTDINNLIFKQIGYAMFYTSQHDITADWQSDENNSKGNIILSKSKDKICLPKEGKYVIKPKSCYKFKDSSFLYNTHNSSLLEFIPIEYESKGKVEIDANVLNEFKKENISELHVSFNISEISPENPLNTFPYKTINHKFNLNKNSHVFSFYTKPNSQFIVTPIINTSNNKINSKIFKTLLFVAKEKKLSLKEECNEDSEDMKFTLKSGVIIKGEITPKMEGILIKAMLKDDIIITTAMTNDKGEYQMGPLSKEQEYTLIAEKEGYKIIPDKTNKYNFIAEKLSFFKVKVVDTNNKPLSGVILSLSSADKGFRINSNTNSEGFYNFIDLSSGDYYVKPFLKEYEFSQSQKLIKIKGGDHIEDTLVAKRVQFSIFGKINNLNQDKVEGLYVQAKNIKNGQIQETALDKNGEYRLRGLTPNEQYSIRVKIPQSSSIEKALPISIPITLGYEDTTNIDFVVLQKSKKIDVRSYISFEDLEEKCPLNKIHNIYVELSKPDVGDEHIIKTAQVSNACQFVFRNLDKEKYHFRIYEKSNKGNEVNKMIKEMTVDLANEKDILNGVKVLNFKIENIKKNNNDNLNYSIFSPLLLFIIMIASLQWDATKKSVIYVYEKINEIIQIFQGKKVYKKKNN